MKIALFDVDGTILNSMGAWENVGRTYLKTKGIQVGKELNDILYSMTILQGASYLKNTYKLEDSTQEIMEAFNKDLNNYYTNCVELKDDIESILEGLHEHGYKLYITTSSTRELVNTSFKRLNIDKYFSGMFTCDSFRLSKSDSLFYKKILLLLKAKPEDVIVFEDNRKAAMAAKSVGLKIVGIYDKHARGNLEEIVDIYINTWKDLL